MTEDTKVTEGIKLDIELLEDALAAVARRPSITLLLSGTQAAALRRVLAELKAQIAPNNLHQRSGATPGQLAELADMAKGELR